MSEVNINENGFFTTPKKLTLKLEYEDDPNFGNFETSWSQESFPTESVEVLIRRVLQEMEASIKSFDLGNGRTIFNMGYGANPEKEDE